MYVTVVGAGRTGHGIGQVSAMAGHRVWPNDTDGDTSRPGVDAFSAEGND